MDTLIIGIMITLIVVFTIGIIRSRQTKKKAENLQRKAQIPATPPEIPYYSGNIRKELHVEEERDDYPDTKETLQVQDEPTAKPGAPPAASPQPPDMIPSTDMPEPPAPQSRRAARQRTQIFDEEAADLFESGASDMDDLSYGSAESNAYESSELGVAKEKSKKQEYEEETALDDLIDARQTFASTSSGEDLPDSAHEPEEAMETMVEIPEQSKTAQFSAYYPRETQANTRHGLYVYAHTPDALEVMNRDVQKFEQELGGEIPRPTTARQSTKIKQGTAITIVPECNEIEFSPPSLTKKWDDEWVRFDFDFKAFDDLIGETLFIRVSVQMAAIEIAHIKCATEVIKKAKTPVDTATKPENPLAAAKMSSQLNKQTANMYDKIFISYSRKDTEVARTYRLAQMAAGHDIFMDTESIHTGEDWKVALAKAIDEADMFQLFWSQNSADSDNVRHEWDYALQYKCADDACVGFIRPVYWKKPMPNPPNELGHLNFRYVPLSGEG